MLQVEKRAKSDSQCRFQFKATLGDEWKDCSREEAVSRIQALQNRRFIDHTKVFKLGQRFELATSDKIEGVPRYSLTVLDAQDEKLFGAKTVGVFVVPLGVEREMDIFNEAEQRALFSVA